MPTLPGTSLKLSSETIVVCRLTQAVNRKVEDFNAQNIANTAWAFATAEQWDEELFITLTQAATGTVEDFNAQGISNTA